MMRRLARAVFYTGRHYAHTTEDRPLPVAAIAAKIRREARERAYGALWLSIQPDVHPFDASIRRALGGAA